MSKLKRYVCVYGIPGAVSGCSTVEDLARYLDKDPHPEYSLKSCNFLSGNWHLVFELICGKEIVEEEKLFPIEDVLSLTTGCVMKDNGMLGVRDVIGYMINDVTVTDSGLIMYRSHCNVSLFKQHPELKNLSFNPDEDNIEEFLDKAIRTLGRNIAVRRLKNENDMRQ